MSPGCLMGRQKKTETEEEFSAEELEELKKPLGRSVPIRVNQDFAEKLEVIAKHLGIKNPDGTRRKITAGAIVELRLRRFVKAHYPLAAKKEQEELAKKARQEEG